MANTKGKTSFLVDGIVQQVESNLSKDKERLTQIMDRLLGELLITSNLLNDLRSWSCLNQ